MPSLKRRKGMVLVNSYGVTFPMIDPVTRAHVTCVHTMAGLERVLGRKNLSLEEMHKIFHKSRSDFEAFAGLLYEAAAGDSLSITITAAPQTAGAESRD